MSAEIVHLDDRLKAERQDFDRIPIVDLSALRSGEDHAEAVSGLRWALANVGFLYVKGHGVSDALVERTFEAARQLFALPDEEKMAIHISKSGEALRGYTEFGGENTNPGITRDLKENFDVGLTYPGLTGPFQGENQWPALPGFRETTEAYLQAMLDTAVLFLEGVALSLDLDRDFFKPKMTQPMMIQRMIHYPSQAGQIDESSIGIGAHTDYGLLTVLAQDNVGGLQVLNRKMQWVEAPPIPGTFVINISDLMQRLTNDTYLANLHRVVNVSGRQRYSLPCFVDCNADAVIEPLPQCIDGDHPSAYGPISAGQNKLNRYAASFAHLN
ncbi:isopenicillin N synthase family oxygenase [Rhodospirillaceae bacterium KN72]|uniref:2-oxoglutarate-dependent ethylene/succinate-forming enzyme n=1 Tax=Pacificispira spongiicola TaxID=2729598 RepID=A0A7Y0DWZ2_9PROT|nr:isopenicillin N synthase family oxygenase [Pacificispira spongiicola]NMM43154.1 isopenicillin N synthase family oxygenase [Pacificispira spongiicola]